MDRLVESLRPRGALEIVDAAAAMLRRRFVDVVGLAALAVLPGVIVGLTVGIERTVEEYGSIDPRIIAFVDDGLVGSGTIFTQLALNSLGLSVLGFGLTRLTVSELMGRHMGSRELAVVCLRAFPRIVGAWLVVHILEALSIIALGIGLVVAMTILMVAIPVVAAESIGVLDMPRRCVELTARSRGRIFGVILVTGVLSMFVGAALALAPTQLTGAFIDGRPLAIASVVYQTLASMVIAAITAGAAVHMYVDLRVRSEGLDLDVKLRALA